MRLVRRHWLTLALGISVTPLLDSRASFIHAALRAQAAPTAAASMTSTMTAPRLYGGSLYVTGDWLQANALPLNRDAMHSVAFDLSYRHQWWAADAGYLRIARDLSTVQGGFLTGSYVYQWNRVTLLPFVGGFAGQALASADSTGYNFVAADGTPGHQARYSYSTGASFGGGVGLTAEVRLLGPVALRLDGAQWFFSGSPVATDRGRTIFGVGLSVRAW